VGRSWIILVAIAGLSGLVALGGCSSSPSSVSRPTPTIRIPRARRTRDTTTTSADVTAGQGLLSGCVSRDGLPDPRCTPGATVPGITQANLHTTICRSGYTRDIRPPVSFTAPLKRALMKVYGSTGSPLTYELDHLIPLELGGSPTATANLWPEPLSGVTGATVKDSIESQLHRTVCQGREPLAVAQRAIATNWTTAH